MRLSLQAICIKPQQKMLWQMHRRGPPNLVLPAQSQVVESRCFKADYLAGKIVLCTRCHGSVLLDHVAALATFFFPGFEL
jgi:hypothetical protein